MRPSSDTRIRLVAYQSLLRVEAAVTQLSNGRWVSVTPLYPDFNAANVSIGAA